MIFYCVDRLATEKPDILTGLPRNISGAITGDSKMSDLTNLRFNKLLVLCEGKNRPHSRLWLCLCDCGNTKLIQHSNLTTGHSKSCGCQRPKGLKHHNYKHGKTGSQTYNKWRGMHQRCNDVNSEKYPIYGGRGITICKRWNEYLNFLTDMGICPKGLSLGRIDNNGNYEPSNCRWENAYQQQNNTRKNRNITYHNTTLTIAQWSRKVSIPYKCLWKRLKNGWAIKDALNKPVKEQRKGQQALFPKE